jgi:hypothetical protein
MKTFLNTLLLTIAIAAVAPSQEQTPQDTTRREMPRLEIPEITIVGKKAITLPFARKGEIYSVPVYEAPPPDSSLIRERLSTGVPVPPLPRYEERVKPWRLSAEGGFGSFGQLNLHGYGDYSSARWGMQVDGGFARSNGHAAHTSGNRISVGGGGYSMFATDSDLLGSLRASIDMGIQGDSYGMYDNTAGTIDRKRTGLRFGAGLGTANATGNGVKIGLGIRTWSVTDAVHGKDSSVTAASPELDVSVDLDAGSVKFLSSLSYAGSSVSGDGPAESPSLLGFTAGARWRFSDEWFIQLGAVFGSGSDAGHTSRSLFSPQAILRWEPDPDREFDIWWLPEISLASYDDLVRQNPYLVRSPGMPVRKEPVRIGSSFRFRSGIVAIELSGSFAQVNSLPMTVAHDGQLAIESADANSTIMQAKAWISTAGNSKLSVTGTFMHVREKGSGEQVPMTPALRVKATGELDVHLPVAFWSSVEFVGSQNTNRTGTETIGSSFLMDAGASLNAFSHITISFELRNLLNSSTEWWKSYSAPGREFRLQAYLGIL